jgi:tetratricopeptide (TPR) repeat protein
MVRSVVATVGVAALVVASAMVWVDARREGEYRRQIAVGDGATAAQQTLAAIEAFSGALALKPDSMIARLKRGAIYLQRAEFLSAVRDLTAAASLDPTAPHPLELLGDAHTALGQYDEAARVYQSSFELDDRQPRLSYKLGVALHLGGHSAQATEALQRAVSLDGDFAEAHHALGLSLLATGRPDRAEQALLRAVSTDPGLTAAREDLVRLYDESARWRQAIEQLEALAALQPTRAEWPVRIGATYARMGRHEAALRELTRAAERHPDSALVATAMGRLWLDAVDADREVTALDRALRSLAPVAERPDATSETLTLYGRALLLSGRVSAAERALRRALEQSPVDPMAFAYLAQAARRLGRSEQAREALLQYNALTGG